MNLKTQSTKWVLFLSCSRATSEFRHVMDLVFGVLCLERAGVRPDDIHIYIDNPPEDAGDLLTEASAHTYNIRPTNQLFTDLACNEYENLVLFVSGHGGPLGIDSSTPISPNYLVTSLKKSPGLKNAVIYLGQCYAGTFNYVQAGSRKNTNEPEVIIIGSTKLHESLSRGTSETFRNSEIRWIANVFLLYVFKWFSKPSDVDGDGELTVMDSYKYAGMYSNMSHKASKTEAFELIIDLHHECKELKALVVQASGDDNQKRTNALSYKAKLEAYRNKLDVHFVHQECWILNSWPAQRIKF